jgi:hypothetical protein
MTEIKVTENFIPLNNKDFITSFDHIDNLIMVNFFDSGIHIYKFNENIYKIEFIENINFEEKILCAKFLKINKEIFLFFCCLSDDNINNTNLFSIKINYKESNIKFSDIKMIKNLNEFITNFSFHKIIDIKNKTEFNYLIADSENSKQIFFYEIKVLNVNEDRNEDQNININNNNNNNENLDPNDNDNNNKNENENYNNNNINFEMILSYKLDLDELDFIYYTLLIVDNLFVVSGILNNNLYSNIDNEENINKSNNNDKDDKSNHNIIRFYKIENNEIKLLSEIFNPLKEITNSINYSNNSGLIIGSLSGRVCVFSNIIINDKNELEFKKFSFKSQYKIIDNDQQLFFPVTCIDSYKEYILIKNKIKLNFIFFNLI